MKKQAVTSDMSPDAVKSYQANMDMIRKVKDTNMPGHGYNLVRGFASDWNSIPYPKQAFLGSLLKMTEPGCRERDPAAPHP